MQTGSAAETTEVAVDPTVDETSEEAPEEIPMPPVSGFTCSGETGILAENICCAVGACVVIALDQLYVSRYCSSYKSSVPRRGVGRWGAARVCWTKFISRASLVPAIVVANGCATVSCVGVPLTYVRTKNSSQVDAWLNHSFMPSIPATALVRHLRG